MPDSWLGWALPAALAIRLGSAAVALAFARRAGVGRDIALAGSALASLVTGGLAASVLATGQGPSGTLLRHAASGLAVGFSVDRLSAWFLLVLAVLAIPVAVYSRAYLGHGASAGRSGFVGVGLCALVGAVELVFVADGVIGFLFAWELMTLVTTALVATEHERPQPRRAALLYLGLSHLATGCLIAGFLLLARRSASLAFAQLLAGDLLPPGPERSGVFLLFLAGFGVKAGMIPLHVWLPEAHPAAPTAVSALMSAVLIKTGIYGLYRVCAFGLGVPSLSWGVLILLCGAASAILGVLYALMQHDIKRLLAYHSIENVGIILLGLGAGMMALSAGRGELAALGIAASLFHVLNHALFKGLLFLGAGGVVMATGTRNIEHMGGLIRAMPWTALFFLVGAASISALPPLNGFASEWLLFQAFLYGFQVSQEALVRFLFPVAGALLALTSALAAACFVKAFGITFLALPRSEAARAAHESPWSMLAPQAALAAACVALGLAPGLALRVLGPVTGSLPGVTPPPGLVLGAFVIAPPEHFDHLVPPLVALALLVGLAAAFALARVAGRAVRLAPTWGCGGELDARTEYTATAFSKPLMLIFAAVYRPTRKVETVGEAHFPTEVKYEAEIEPTFERYLYAPLARAVMNAASRMKVIQAGSLHAYLAYVIALVLGLVLLLWWRG
ncbi:MAG: hydrogenase 4 subunit B [Vicinamibacteria bacterium]|nr:hydrogenase 4 subunit B [Vicinamibacteria bacterium]